MSTIGVFITPGCTELTRMLSGALDSGGFGEDADRPFTRMICRRSSRTYKTVDRGNVDDGSTAALFHGGNRYLGPQPYALLIHIDDSVPFLLVGIAHSLDVENARVIDQDIEATKLAFARLNRRAPILGSRHVQMNRQS